MSNQNLPLTIQQVNLARAFFEVPPSAPVIVPGFPVPCWNVPPLWRVAWLSDLSRVAGLPAETDVDSVSHILGVLNITWFAPAELNGRSEPLVIWPVRRVSDWLVLWRAL